MTSVWTGTVKFSRIGFFGRSCRKGPFSILSSTQIRRFGESCSQFPGGKLHHHPPTHFIFLFVADSILYSVPSNYLRHRVSVIPLAYKMASFDKLAFAVCLWFSILVVAKAFMPPQSDYRKKIASLPTLFASLSETPSAKRKAKTTDGLSRGDARGAAVLLEGVSIARGSAQILEGIDWRVEPKSKWAVIGTNGAG